MVSKRFPAKTEQLDAAIAFVEAELDKIDCPMKSVMQITVCVEEMFVNVASYAYEGQPGEIELSVDDARDTVTITLTDAGIPFDPLAKEDPDITLSADERNIGGLGIFMVKKSMNEVSYERKNDRNIFTMVKHIR